MKKQILVLIAFAAASVITYYGCAPSPEAPSGMEQQRVERAIEDPAPVEGKEDFFQADRFYFSGQPDEETFQWLFEQGVTVVVNLRTDEEMDKLKEEKFDEAALLQEAGIAYVRIPMGGDIGYNAQSVEILADTIKNNTGKILIHCTMGGRVSWFWAAYLVRYKDFSIDDALEYGRKMKLIFPLDEMLGYPVTIHKK